MDFLLHTPMWLMFRALPCRSFTTQDGLLDFHWHHLSQYCEIHQYLLCCGVCNTTALDNVRWDLKQNLRNKNKSLWLFPNFYCLLHVHLVMSSSLKDLLSSILLHTSGSTSECFVWPLLAILFAWNLWYFCLFGLQPSQFLCHSTNNVATAVTWPKIKLILILCS